MFNIYLEHVMQKIKEAIKLDNFWYRAYADDLVIIVKHDKIPITIKKVKEISEKYNFKFNSKKSNWLKIGNHKGVEYELEQTCNVALEERYNYLGVNIDNHGHVYLIRQKTIKRDRYIRFKTYFYAKQLTFEN